MEQLAYSSQTAQKITSVVIGEGHKTVITFDLQLYEKAVKLQLHTAPALDHLVFRIGEMHTVMASLRGLGASIEDTGLDNAWVEVNLYGPTTMRQILDGNHMKRALTAHTITTSALFDLYLDAFLKTVGDLQQNTSKTMHSSFKFNHGKPGLEQQWTQSQSRTVASPDGSRRFAYVQLVWRNLWKSQFKCDDWRWWWWWRRWWVFKSVNKCVVTEVVTEVAGLKHYPWTSEIWQYMHIWRPSWIFKMNNSSNQTDMCFKWILTPIIPILALYSTTISQRRWNMAKYTYFSAFWRPYWIFEMNNSSNQPQLYSNWILEAKIPILNHGDISTERRYIAKIWLFGRHLGFMQIRDTAW